MEKFYKAIGKIIIAIITICLLTLLMAFPTKWCWNYVMPYIFKLPIITWGQAWCLTFLASCLIKSSLSHNT